MGTLIIQKKSSWRFIETVAQFIYIKWFLYFLYFGKIEIVSESQSRVFGTVKFRRRLSFADFGENKKI